VLLATGAISRMPGCIENCSFFTTDAILFSKLQFLYYRCQAVLKVAISLLQEAVCTGIRNFFTKGASLYCNSQFLHYRSRSVLDVAVCLLQERVCVGSRNFFITGASLCSESQFRLPRFRCRWASGALWPLARFHWCQAVLKVVVSLLQMPFCSRN